MHTNPIQFPWQRQIPLKQIAAAAQALIDLLDAAGGDADLEPNGDELDGDRAEDEFGDLLTYAAGAGCPISDPPEEDAEDCSGFEDEPLFDRSQCAMLNRMFGDGPGGGSALDSDLGGDGS